MRIITGFNLEVHDYGSSTRYRFGDHRKLLQFIRTAAENHIPYKDSNGETHDIEFTIEPDYDELDILFESDEPLPDGAEISLDFIDEVKEVE